MVQSPSWAANCFAASQEIPRISRNTKVHFRTQKRPPHVSILGQPNPVHIPTSHLLEIHPNIIHPSTPMWRYFIFKNYVPFNDIKHTRFNLRSSQRWTWMWRPSAPRSPIWPLSFRFPHRNLTRICLLPHACHMSVHLIILDFVPVTLRHSMGHNFILGVPGSHTATHHIRYN